MWDVGNVNKNLISGKEKEEDKLTNNVSLGKNKIENCEFSNNSLTFSVFEA
jgi:hypothetical protein